MAFIWEMQKPRWHAQTLQDIECLETLSLDNTIIEIVMDDELWCASVAKVSQRIVLLVVVAVVPDGAVVVMLDKP